ncbi:hypothetical protein ABM074_01485, partial [Morganella morganii]
MLLISTIFFPAIFPFPFRQKCRLLLSDTSKNRSFIDYKAIFYWHVICIDDISFLTLLLPGQGKGRQMNKVISVCPYCGAGC